MQIILKRITSLLLASMVLVALAACTIQPAGTSTDEHAAENRQYMAMLNQKTGELDDVLTQFQAAVSAGDTVGMKAASSDASKVVEAIKSSEATESLADVKEAYVAGLTEMNEALDSYVDLYTQVSAGTLNQAGFDRKIKGVQISYDQALEKLTAADELLTQLANE